MSIIDIRAALEDGLAGRATVNRCTLQPVEGGRFQMLDVAIALPDGTQQMLSKLFPRGHDMQTAARELGRAAIETAD